MVVVTSVLLSHAIIGLGRSHVVAERYSGHSPVSRATAPPRAAGDRLPPDHPNHRTTEPPNAFSPSPCRPFPASPRPRASTGNRLPPDQPNPRATERLLPLAASPLPRVPASPFPPPASTPYARASGPAGRA